MNQFAMPDGEIFLSRETHRPSLSRALAAGEVERLRHGAYRAAAGEATSPHAASRARALGRANAVHRQLSAPHVFSHETAALVQGCALWRLPARTHVVQGYRASGGSARDVARHLVPVPSRQRTTVGGLPVTSLARTVVDCALTMLPLEALVVADSACALGLDRAEAEQVLAELRTRNGRRRAAWVLDHADEGAASPWETWLRYVCLRAGLPRPTTQAPVRTLQGVFHCDLGWPEHRVFAEFDGRSKYRDGALRPGHDGVRELLDEKRRYEAVRSAGVDPVRVMATYGPGVAQVVGRLAARFPPKVRATFRPDPLLPPPS